MTDRPNNQWVHCFQKVWEPLTLTIWSRKKKKSKPGRMAISGIHSCTTINAWFGRRRHCYGERELFVSRHLYSVTTFVHSIFCFLFFFFFFLSCQKKAAVEQDKHEVHLKIKSQVQNNKGVFHFLLLEFLVFNFFSVI